MTRSSGFASSQFTLVFLLSLLSIGAPQRAEARLFGPGGFFNRLFGGRARVVDRRFARRPFVNVVNPNRAFLFGNNQFGHQFGNQNLFFDPNTNSFRPIDLDTLGVGDLGLNGAIDDGSGFGDGRCSSLGDREFGRFTGVFGNNEDVGRVGGSGVFLTTSDNQSVEIRGLNRGGVVFCNGFNGPLCAGGVNLPSGWRRRAVWIEGSRVPRLAADGSCVFVIEASRWGFSEEPGFTAERVPF